MFNIFIFSRISRKCRFPKLLAINLFDFRYSNYFNEYFKEKKIIENFLIKTDFIEKEEESHEFDYNLNAGDAIIFDEGGVHKGSKTLYNDRMVLRYIYSVSI